MFAESLGYSVSFEMIEGSAGGWCDPNAKQIVIDAGVPANAQLRTLIHECAHALGIDYQQYSRAQAEVIVDTVTLLAASAVGLAVDGETVPYVSGWREHGALEALTEFAETIDRVARRIEDASTERRTTPRGGDTCSTPASTRGPRPPCPGRGHRRRFQRATGAG